jgi:hypothetical protein
MTSLARDIAVLHRARCQRRTSFGANSMESGARATQSWNRSWKSDCAISVPVRDHAGSVVAAMNIGTHASRVSLAEMEMTFLRELEAAANELGSSLMA